MKANAKTAFTGALIGLLLAGPAHADSRPSHRTGPQSAKPRIHRLNLDDLAYDDPRRAPPSLNEPAAPSADGAWQQSGIASWYGGSRWQGHATSSGTTFNDSELTAAHATLPFGTRVRVTVENTGRSIEVLINDRPGTRTRIIDLSRGAAHALGMIQSGVAKVTLSRL